MTKLLLIAIVCLGLFFRTYKYAEFFFYAHDNDLASWFYKDVVIDHHLRLIGQETSSRGVFVGPLFYYLLIPLYELTNGDPIGTLGMAWIVGFASIISLTWVFTKLYSSKVGLIAALLHAASFGSALNEREVVPTTPVILWTVWFFYAIHRLFQGDKKSLYILAILFGLIWHMNLALVLLFPLVPLGLIYSRKFKPMDLVKPLLLLLLLLTPFFVFEIKHGFQQIRALASTLTGSDGAATNHIDKFNRAIEVAIRNINFIYHQTSLPKVILPIILLISLFTPVKQPTDKYKWILYIVWIASFILFFSFQSINLSEYYLNGLNILWLAAGALLLARLPNVVTVLLLLLFMAHNIQLLTNFTINRNGYVYKKALVNFIKTDAAKHNYPCVAVSYITDPGFDLGYRYFFYLANLHVNLPKRGSPVYTIVFPHSRVNRIDQSFGALGLVLPDYASYSEEEIQASCTGDNDNLTQPMFGFTN